MPPAPSAAVPLPHHRGLPEAGGRDHHAPHRRPVLLHQRECLAPDAIHPALPPPFLLPPFMSPRPLPSSAPSSKPAPSFSAFPSFPNRKEPVIWSLPPSLLSPPLCTPTISTLLSPASSPLPDQRLVHEEMPRSEFSLHRWLLPATLVSREVPRGWGRDTIQIAGEMTLLGEDSPSPDSCSPTSGRGQCQAVESCV